MTKGLIQTVIGTKGQLVTVIQDRDAKGRFIKGARVLRGQRLALAEMNFDTTISRTAGRTSVLVLHHFDVTGNPDQLVTVLRPGGRATSKTFLNDGYSIGATAKKNKTFHNELVVSK